MKASLLLLMVGGAFLVTPTAQAEPLNKPALVTPKRKADPIKHRIAEVTVYRDRALITRNGTTTLKPGVHEIVFDQLPNALDENSVRAGGEGTARFKILGVELRRQYQKPNQDSAVAQLEERMRGLEDRRQTIGDERKTLNQQQQFLQQMRDKVLTDTKKVSQESQLVSVKSLEEIFAFYSNEIGKISDSLRSLQLEERDLNEERQELQKQISLLQRPSDPDTRSAVVKVDVARPGSAAFRLSYLMRGATWTPQYDAFAQTKDKKVALTYYGTVRQTTGESWKDVKLSLSTARPNQSARLPQLESWMIGLAKPIVSSQLSEVDESSFSLGSSADSFKERAKYIREMKKAWGRGGTAGHASGYNATRNATSAYDGETQEARRERAQAAGAILVDNGPTATFEVPGTVTIPSDGQTHRTTINQLAFKSEFVYEATPKLAEAAFLRATTTNTSGVPLLPGKINVFQGNDYIGQSQLDLIAPAAKFDLYLGVDDGIKITREAKVPQQKISGLFTAEKKYELGYSIKVENFKSQAEKIIIHDQLPISKTDEIKVAVQKVSKGAQQDEFTGKVTWEFSLAPQKDKELLVNYEVSCPPDATIAGL